MSRKIETKGKLILFVVGFAILFFGYRAAVSHGLIAPIGVLQSVVPQKVSLPDVKDSLAENVAPSAYPTTTPNGCGEPIRSDIWAWNSQLGELYANGGVDTTKGSLMEKYGACVHYQRQDDTVQMAADLVSCAKEMGDKGSECLNGVHFVTIMMDGSGQFLATLNPLLAKICKDCTAEIEGTFGQSRGEDGYWGPEAWKKQPRQALGDGLNAGVLRDGDWNTAQKWIGDNALKNNPDEKTFDPDAINWVNAADYLKAAEMYISGYCEDRKVIKNGRLTGEIVNKCVRGFVSWTPGDVNAAKKKGGLVKIVSTKQYRSQMPSALIGLKKWSRAHSDKVAAMLAAGLEGGDQVKAFPEAMKRAGDISASIYCQNNLCTASEQQSGAYWVKYYKGVTENDATGKPVELGGSYADNMNDALSSFGLSAGSNDNVKATYTVFAKIVDAQYHDLFAKTPIPAYKEVVNTSYLLQAKTLLDSLGSEADAPKFSSDTEPTETFGDKNWDIQFATGSDKLTSEGLQTVKQIKDETAITGLTIVLNGHTDNTGSADKNKGLSEDRARSVRNALKQLAPANFPDERFRVKGYGDARPIADNSTAAGKSKNRRVEVILAQ